MTVTRITPARPTENRLGRTVAQSRDASDTQAPDHRGTGKLACVAYYYRADGLHIISDSDNGISPWSLPGSGPGPAAAARPPRQAPT
jgi:hypothetical protein